MKKNYRFIKLLSTVILSLGVVSCAKKTPPQPEVIQIEEPQPSNLVHKVSFSGETLAMIANWYTGKSANWKLIMEANPKIKPEKITLGQEIIIPGNLVVQRNPLPKKFLQESFSKKKIPTNQAVVDDVLKDQPAVESTKPSSTLPEDQAAKRPSDVINAIPDITPPVAIETPKVPEAKETTNIILKQAEEVNKNAKTGVQEKSDKAVKSDEEREKLLDELLTQ